METIGVVLGVLLGGLGATLSILATRNVQRVQNSAPKSTPDDVMRAFKHLESDFEELDHRVRSHLGRISRLKQQALKIDELKRMIDPSAAADEANMSEEPSDTPPNPLPPSKPMSRTELLARLRRGGSAER